MKLPIIEGRECVPVRLLPYLTRSQTLSADNAARIFGWRHPSGEVRSWKKDTYQLQPEGGFRPLERRDWYAIVERLATLETQLQRRETSEAEQYAEWQRGSVEILPAGVFVWRDDLEAEYARMFGDQTFFVERPGLSDLTEEQCEAQLNKLIQLSAAPDPDGKLQSVIDRMAEASAACMMTNPGDGELSFNPLMSAEDRQLAFDGFGPLLSNIPDCIGTQSKLTEKQRTTIRAKLKKRETVTALAHEFGVSRRTIDKCKPPKAISLGEAWPSTVKRHRIK